MFKLIRDKIPQVLAEKGLSCNFAQIKNKELFDTFLKAKIIEEVNELLQAKTVSEFLEELVDIQLIINTLANEYKEEFNTVYHNKLEMYGEFNEQYIGFFEDTEKGRK